jgi:RNA polymerase subunit RPABC4/transcription elongation factor Spt4
MFLNDYAQDTKICCFCERIFDADEFLCGLCNDYKGMMTIAEFNRVYGD